MKRNNTAPLPSAKRQRTDQNGFLNSITCPICFYIYRSPRILPCGHTFCLQCLQQCNTSISNTTCPLCANHTSQSASTFPINFVAQNIIAAEQSRVANTTVCGFCKQETRLYCSKCEDYICSQCVREHSVSPFTKFHPQPVELAPPVPEYKEGDCRVHHKQATNYCLSCAKEVCVKCECFRDLFNHNVKSLAEAEQTKRKGLQDALSLSCLDTKAKIYLEKAKVHGAKEKDLKTKIEKLKMELQEVEEARIIANTAARGAIDVRDDIRNTIANIPVNDLFNPAKYNAYKEELQTKHKNSLLSASIVASNNQNRS